MNFRVASTGRGKQTGWLQAAEEAVVRQDGCFLRRSISDQSWRAPSASKAVLRSWLYRDVHVRQNDEVVAFLGYEELPIGGSLRDATFRMPGWRLDADVLVHEGLQLSLVPREKNVDGFVLEGDEVELPRLRCGTSPGWLTVAGLNGEVPRRCCRLYLPGVDLARIDVVVEALDSSGSGLAWSLKSSVGVARDGRDVSRADRTVIYVANPGRAKTREFSAFLGALSATAPAGLGPGFSVKIRPGVYFGGHGNEHGSFGTRMAAIAADALLEGDPSSLLSAEQRLLADAAQLQARRG